MMWFFICVALLLLGYFFYSKVIEKIFVIRPERQTPAYSMTDGVDYVPMSKKRVWLIQLLNIAGTGPIFGTHFGCIVWACGDVVDCVCVYFCRRGTRLFNRHVEHTQWWRKRALFGRQIFGQFI